GVLAPAVAADAAQVAVLREEELSHQGPDVQRRSDLLLHPESGEEPGQPETLVGFHDDLLAVTNRFPAIRGEEKSSPSMRIPRPATALVGRPPSRYGTWNQRQNRFAPSTTWGSNPDSRSRASRSSVR